MLDSCHAILRMFVDDRSSSPVAERIVSMTARIGDGTALVVPLKHTPSALKRSRVSMLL